MSFNSLQDEQADKQWKTKRNNHGLKADEGSILGHLRQPRNGANLKNEGRGEIFVTALDNTENEKKKIYLPYRWGTEGNIADLCWLNKGCLIEKALPNSHLITGTNNGKRGTAQHRYTWAAINTSPAEAIRVSLLDVKNSLSSSLFVGGHHIAEPFLLYLLFSFWFFLFFSIWSVYFPRAHIINRVIIVSFFIPDCVQTQEVITVTLWNAKALYDLPKTTIRSYTCWLLRLK